MLSVPLRFSAMEAAPRHGEPVCVGVPWPRGSVVDDSLFALIGPDGKSQTLQTDVLDRWHDGSIRWCLFDFFANWDGKTPDAGYRLVVATRPRTNTIVSHRSNQLPGTFSICINGQPETFDHGVTGQPECLLNGTLRSRWKHSWRLRDGGNLDCQYETFRDSDAFRIAVAITNSNAAEHPGGNWDLGKRGSFILNAIRFDASLDGTDGLQFSRDRGVPFHSASSLRFSQHSSGGQNWNSRNHLGRDRRLTVTVRGCETVIDGRRTGYERVTPIVAVDAGAVTMEYFWEKFPSQIEADSNGIRLWLLPENMVQELQGGEQVTYKFSVVRKTDTITQDPLVWARSPIVATAMPKWYAVTGAVPYLTPNFADPHSVYLGLVDLAIEGSDTIFDKREKIDEYGWRHFGDIYGDHEAVYDPGSEPMVSHYNNQYDCVGGFLTQYLRSGDVRWLRLGTECADHTCDIDIYHTTKDKWAYNGGLFWHTYHYAPADTGTHRSYPRSLRDARHFESGQDLEKLGSTGASLKKNYSVGGGPSAAHNYNSGLMLAWFLTGKPIYRETAIGLADFVLNMDDGTRTVFRWLSRRDTGLAIQSSDGYLGPGRASANSLLAVLVGLRLTGENKYLAKANQIVRRVVHPAQDLESLDLLNAELRWFYTMFLQALGHYLDDKAERGELDDDYCYARLSLLHFARYMANHETPILDHPEKLQYPTETWAAQDMRKMEVFQFAAKHSEGAERQLFLEKAEWYFRYVESTLDGFPTKSLCRPVVLMMNFGWSRAWWKQHPDAFAPLPHAVKMPEDYGSWTMYVPQKAAAIKRAKVIIKGAAVLGFITTIVILINLFR